MGIEAQPVALFLHGLAAPRDGTVERRRCPRYRAGNVSPVVRQERKVHHPEPARREQLGGSQYQIMILRSIDFGAKHADLTDNFAP
jgi:hypothetical protein